MLRARPDLFAGARQETTASSMAKKRGGPGGGQWEQREVAYPSNSFYIGGFVQDFRHDWRQFLTQAQAEGRYTIEPGHFKDEKPVYLHNQTREHFRIVYVAQAAEWQLQHMPPQGHNVVILRGKGNGDLDKVMEWWTGDRRQLLHSVSMIRVVECPVCNQPFGYDASLQAHIRDKRNHEHEEYRCGQQQTVAKKPRTRASHGANIANKSCSMAC